MTSILPIVEGDGDLAAVPELMRRMLYERLGRHDVEVMKPRKRGEWPKVKREFDRFYLAACLENAPILWVLDFDCDECQDVDAERAWALEQAARLDPRGRIEVVFIVKEYESLFLAEEQAVRRAFPEMPAGTVFPRDVESVRDAKGWISQALPKGRAYKPTTDQARITARLDLERLPSISPSYRRFEESLNRLIA